MAKKKMKGGALEQAMPSIAGKPSHDYETEGHLRTLMDAEQIKQDPEKMKKVHKLAGRHKMAIRSIQQLKDLHQSKYGPEGSAQEEASESPAEEAAEGD